MGIKLLVDGGAMKPGPAVSQTLGPMGINVNEVISAVNKATEGLKGMQVPVEIVVDAATKTFEIIVSSPPISGLLKKEAGVEKGSGAQDTIKVANLSIEQIIKVANTKLPGLLCNNLKAAVKITVGSCVSLGFLIENKPAVELNADIDSGMYDEQINAIATETSEEKKKELDDYFKEIKAAQDLKIKQEAEEAKE